MRVTQLVSGRDAAPSPRFRNSRPGVPTRSVGSHNTVAFFRSRHYFHTVFFIERNHIKLEDAACFHYAGTPQASQ